MCNLYGVFKFVPLRLNTSKTQISGSRTDNNYQKKENLCTPRYNTNFHPCVILIPGQLNMLNSHVLLKFGNRKILPEFS